MGDAGYALLAMFAEDMYGNPTVVEPAADTRLAAAGLTLVGYLVGDDMLFRPRATLNINPSQHVFYGYHATTGVTDVVVVRGTDGLIEWLEDGEFALRAHPDGYGQVEAGFYGVYSSLCYRPPGGPEQNLIPGLKAATAGRPTVVVGHSLGAAVATYLALDLAQAQHGVSARFFASPHPGNSSFAHAFATLVTDSKAYAYALDIVPRVPFALGYAPLESVIELGPGDVATRIRKNILCNHHALCYAAMLDADALGALQAADAQFRDCLLVG